MSKYGESINISGILKYLARFEPIDEMPGSDLLNPLPTIWPPCSEFNDIKDWHKHLLIHMSTGSQRDFISNASEEEIKTIWKYHCSKYNPANNNMFALVFDSPNLNAQINDTNYERLVNYINTICVYNKYDTVQAILYICKCIFINKYATKEQFSMMFIHILTEYYNMFVFGGSVMSQISGIPTRDIDVVGWPRDIDLFIGDMTTILAGCSFKTMNAKSSYSTQNVRRYCLTINNNINIEFDFVNYSFFSQTNVDYEQSAIVLGKHGIITHKNDLRINRSNLVQLRSDRVKVNKIIRQLRDSYLTINPWFYEHTSGDNHLNWKIVKIITRYYAKSAQGYKCERPSVGMNCVITRTFKSTIRVIQKKSIPDLSILLCEFLGVPCEKELCAFCKIDIYVTFGIDMYPRIMTLTCCGKFVHTSCLLQHPIRCNGCMSPIVFV
jgi:hypothetical protein